MLSGIINQTEWLRNEDKPPFVAHREQGDMTVKCKAGVTVAGVIESLKAFAMATAELKKSAFNTALRAKGAQCLGLAQSFIPLC